ncbi:hypothetical protein BV20DRAFT_969361 [Pilatotrama ljubarskyi]|nr:hypothetical protein BV20DRAFT_969361 [Pilatotrama ljubarskyi]
MRSGERPRLGRGAALPLLSVFATLLAIFRFFGGVHARVANPKADDDEHDDLAYRRLVSR